MEFILSGFGDEIDPSLEVQMAHMGRLGIRHIELRGIDGRNIADYRHDEASGLIARLRARGFSASALGTPLGKIGVEEPFAPHLAVFRRMLDVAEVLRCPYIRMFSFFIPKGEEPERHKAEVFDRLEAFAKAAQGRKVSLVHENEKQIYGDTPERCLEIMQAFEGAIHMTYDPSNFVQCGVDNKRAFPMLQDYIRYVHVKDSVYTEREADKDQGFAQVADTHRPAGEGDGNVLWMLTELARMNYKGFLSIEPHLAHYSGVQGTGADKFTAAYEALSALLAQL